MLAWQHTTSSVADSVEFVLIHVVACRNGKFGGTCRAIVLNSLIPLIEFLEKDERTIDEVFDGHRSGELVPPGRGGNSIGDSARQQSGHRASIREFFGLKDTHGTEMTDGQVQIGSPSVVGKLCREQDGDVLREGVRVLTQALMEVEVTELVGAERYESTDARAAHRNGSRSRNLDTRAWTFTVRRSAISAPGGWSGGNAARSPASRT